MLSALSIARSEICGKFSWNFVEVGRSLCNFDRFVLSYHCGRFIHCRDGSKEEDGSSETGALVAVYLC